LHRVDEAGGGAQLLQVRVQVVEDGHPVHVYNNMQNVEDGRPAECMGAGGSTYTVRPPYRVYAQWVQVLDDGHVYTCTIT
jgi:hypothetical protein